MEHIMFCSYCNKDTIHIVGNTLEGVRKPVFLCNECGILNIEEQHNINHNKEKEMIYKYCKECKKVTEHYPKGVCTICGYKENNMLQEPKDYTIPTGGKLRVLTCEGCAAISCEMCAIGPKRNVCEGCEAFDCATCAIAPKNSHTGLKGLHDAVEKPKHYNMGIETIEYIESWEMNYIEGNIIKYITRYKYKNGLEDLKKCRWYLDRLIKKCEEKDKRNL